MASLLQVIFVLLSQQVLAQINSFECERTSGQNIKLPPQLQRDTILKSLLLKQFQGHCAGYCDSLSTQNLVVNCIGQYEISAPIDHDADTGSGFHACNIKVKGEGLMECECSGECYKSILNSGVSDAPTSARLSLVALAIAAIGLVFTF
eukprot:gnl/MRDRNA2_/MRDRNA2_78950_c0_seq1.p1 gnl/MRDRNA2_/MRDRNA2_78950_c0~~gnl/MRDRNA2_/MRDRNA2_78950_c0_seq1.p1  ORF type:complete len:149 (-),score=25.23 gnl/MRDRNA2_/MRDRNA2_78950_c0_seq1:16-462(-)